MHNISTAAHCSREPADKIASDTCACFFSAASRRARSFSRALRCACSSACHVLDAHHHHHRTIGNVSCHTARLHKAGSSTDSPTLPQTRQPTHTSIRERSMAWRIAERPCSASTAMRCRRRRASAAICSSRCSMVSLRILTNGSWYASSRISSKSCVRAST